MFCKWCGNTIKTTDKKCSSCGRETPPLSDCGGFYDLKRPWEAAAPVPERGSEAEAVYTAMETGSGYNPEIHRLKEENRTIRQEANDRHRLMLVICGALAVAFLIVLILWIVALSGDDSAAQQPLPNNPGISTENKTPEVVPTGTTVSSEPAESTGVTDPTEITEPVTSKAADIAIWENAVTVDGADASNAEQCNPEEENITVKLYWEKKAKSENLPEEEENAKEQDKTDEDESTEFDYENADAAVLIASWDRDFREGIKLSLDLSQMTGYDTVKFDWKWQGGILSGNDDNDNNTSTITRNLLPDDGDGEFEISCEITAENENGEKLTITLRGFRLERNRGDDYTVRFAQQEIKENENI